jgi:hypothetical protein
MRRHIRHSTDVPIDVRLSQTVPGDREYLCNISRGGLCFRSLAPIAEGISIRIEVPVAQPVFETEGIVAWCRPSDQGYEVGVRFTGCRQDPQLVAEVHQVEHYKREVWVRDGRLLSGEEAAAERTAQSGREKTP